MLLYHLSWFLSLSFQYSTMLFYLTNDFKFNNFSCHLQVQSSISERVKTFIYRKYFFFCLEFSSNCMIFIVGALWSAASASMSTKHSTFGWQIGRYGSRIPLLARLSAIEKRVIVECFLSAFEADAAEAGAFDVFCVIFGGLSSSFLSTIFVQTLLSRNFVFFNN